MSSADIRESKESNNLQADVVVIGGGGAGMAAAVTAAGSGASVIVLEKLASTGGSSAMAVGPFAADSPAQKRQGILADKDILFKRAMDWSHWKINPRIVRAFIDRSGDTISWLEAKGLRFTLVPHSPTDNPMTWHIPKGYGREIMKILAGDCEKLGVKVLKRTPAKQIRTDAGGNVTGVTAENNGTDITIETRSVIIASGGYGGNKELLKKYCPEYMESVPCRGLPNQGDGLTMATEIGAAAEGLGIFLWGGPYGRILSGAVSPLIPISREPYLLWVNKKGRRYIDESVIMNSIYVTGNAVLLQPGKISYSIFDAGMIKLLQQQGMIYGPWGMVLGDDFTNMPPENWEKNLDVYIESGRMKISGSWGEIADWIGVDMAVLKSTVDEYNDVCDRGYDPVFAKDRKYLVPLRTPPYYAVECHMGMMNTIGGIKINEHMEVMDKQDNAIPGLYAAGVDTGGWVTDTYCSILPGSAFGFALNSGRIAGERAADYVLGEHFKPI
jgi:fumarate reductase flavoprotein subunit